jgi:hypothetical protein
MAQSEVLDVKPLARIVEDGDGSGYGYGYGYGDGYGYGYGYGDGSGDGYGYWLALVDTFSKAWPAEQVQRLTELRAGGAIIALWKSDAQGRPSNGGSGTVARAGLREKIAGPLEICTRRALHASQNPTKWEGERLWVVALFGDVQTDDDKYGALEREILGECVLEGLSQ